MSQDRNIAIAQAFLEGLGSERDPGEIGAPFAPDLIFEIQGDETAFPWIGFKHGRSALEQFIRDIRELTEPISFEVEDILASETRVAIIGALKTRIKTTQKITKSQFAIILTIAGETVIRFQMLEDSLDVSTSAIP